MYRRCLLYTSPQAQFVFLFKKRDLNARLSDKKSRFLPQTGNDQCGIRRCLDIAGEKIIRTNMIAAAGNKIEM